MGDKKDDFGNRMKDYERTETGRRTIPLLPIVVRLDGRSFSRYTRNLARPYDVDFQRVMQNLTRLLVQETNARIGYTQSDEITLILASDTHASQVYFDGRLFKIHSVLSGFASVSFDRLIRMSGVNVSETAIPVFDCRAFQVPNRVEAVNALLWREKDATKNAISMAAQHHFSHTRLQGLSGKQMQELLWQEKGVNFNDYPPEFKRGTYVQRRRVFKELDQDVLDRIPPEHRPVGPVERWEIQQIEMPPLSKIMNRTEVVFNGADPETDTEQD